jgi:uncharacterized membrane protein
MGQDPNQPYSGPYGQPGGTPPVPPPQGQGSYPGGYQQQQSGPYQQPNSSYQQPPANPYQQPGGPYQQPNSGPYQQQPYGQTGYQTYNTAHPNGATSINMDPNVAAGLSYLGTWLTGLIFFLIEKQNRFVRFHAMQSILTFAAFTVLYIVASIVFALPFLSIVGCFITPLIGLAGLALWIVCMVQAFQGKYFKLPIVGDYAERIVNGGTGV